MGKVLPEGGAHPTDGLGSALSVADGVVYVTVAPAPLVAGTVMLPGTFDSVGFTLSVTVT
jgi:hypothetical protein